MHGGPESGELAALGCGILIGLFLRIARPLRRRSRGRSPQPYRERKRRPKRVA